MIFSTVIRFARRISFRMLTLLLLLIGSVSAIAQPALSENEDRRSMQWLVNTQSSPPNSTLLNVLLSIHHNFSTPLTSVVDAEITPDRNRLILSSLIYQCSRVSEFPYCEDSSLENRLLELDSNNLIPHLHLFNHHLAENDIDSALSSLQEGLETMETNDYYFEKVMYLRNALQPIGFVDNRANLASEIYSLNGLVETYINIIPACIEHAVTSQEWKDTCLTLSLRLEQGTTFFSNVYGAAIRRDVVSATSSREADIQAAAEHRAYYDDFRKNARSKLTWWDDPAGRPNSFYENAAVFGELRAIEMEIQ